LMNLTNADTLAPIMKMQRSDPARACGNGLLSFNRSKQLENSLENNSGLENIQLVGRTRLDADRRPGLLL